MMKGYCSDWQSVINDVQLGGIENVTSVTKCQKESICLRERKKYGKALRNERLVLIALMRTVAK